MERIHHCSTLDSMMDMTDEGHMEGMMMETDNKQNTDNDFSVSLSDETHHRPPGSCGVRARPRLQSTKSFPPYNQCIGGLGDDGAPDISLRDEDMMKEGGSELDDGTERREGWKLKARCARDEVKAKRRRRRWERLGGSCEVDPDRGESAQWSRRGREREEDEERVRPPVAAEEGDNERSEETPEAEGQLGMEENPTTHQWSCPHPILSKLLQSSSTSSCSSISLSSAESDEVFSEGEDAGSKGKFRKCRHWKTYLTMMHWSLRRQSSWVQLAGHQGNFQLSDGGEVLKLYSEVEAKCLDSLMRDPLRPFVPQYYGLVTRGERCYIRLEDLLRGLRRPVIMDCKMGVRTYLEEEQIKAQLKAPLRSDMYQKMVQIDPSAPSAEEHAQRGVTKWRYLQWRDTTSSTSLLGLRIEGIMMEDGSIQRDFRKILTLAQVTEALLYFTGGQLDVLRAYHSRLLALSEALKNSLFFRTHEMIGSSLLFVHDHCSKASVWMIDFGKTSPVSDGELLHDVPWAEGSREDGYLIGLSSLITSLSQAISVASWQQEEGEMSVT